MSKLARFRSFFPPAIIGLALAVVAGLYYFAWLPSQQRYLDDRNFRLLTTLGEQISASINNFDKVLDHASDSGITGKTLAEYLKIVAPQLSTFEDSPDKQVIGGDYGDPPKMTVMANEGTHFLYLAFQRNWDKTETKAKAETNYAVGTDLDKLIRELVSPANRNPFDVVLVAQSNGTVIFQSSAPGLGVATIDWFEDESEVAKTGKPEPVNCEGGA
jgi:hypothetical protein